MSRTDRCLGRLVATSLSQTHEAGDNGKRNRGECDEGIHFDTGCAGVSRVTFSFGTQRWSWSGNTFERQTDRQSHTHTQMNRSNEKVRLFEIK